LKLKGNELKEGATSEERVVVRLRVMLIGK
jgi:hypothetical protein